MADRSATRQPGRPRKRGPQRPSNVSARPVHRGHGGFPNGRESPIVRRPGGTRQQPHRAPYAPSRGEVPSRRPGRWRCRLDRRQRPAGPRVPETARCRRPPRPIPKVPRQGGRLPRWAGAASAGHCGSPAPAARGRRRLTPRPSTCPRRWRPRSDRGAAAMRHWHPPSGSARRRAAAERPTRHDRGEGETGGLHPSRATPPQRDASLPRRRRIPLFTRRSGSAITRTPSMSRTTVEWPSQATPIRIAATRLSGGAPLVQTRQAHAFVCDQSCRRLAARGHPPRVRHARLPETTEPRDPHCFTHLRAQGDSHDIRLRSSPR